MWLFISIIITNNNNVAVAQYTDVFPVIDGKLEETVWDSAFVIKDFVQLIPKKGDLPTESTSVYILYDKDNLYIGVKCFDDPAKVKADCRIRDNQKVGWDDMVLVYLSPSYDKNSGYSFCVNAIGTQTDSKVLENGNDFDDEWDGVWVSKTSITKYGWETEISIPFSILRYDKKVKTWGFNFGRGIIRKMEGVFWGVCSSENKVSEWGILNIDTDKILHKSGRVKDLSLTPYFLFGKDTMNLGMENVRYNLSEKSTIEFTINPDYANVEADVDEFTLDKLPLYLPEKRPFFSEERDLFATPVELMYTRSIGNIAGGGKFTGRFKNTDIGVLGTVMSDTIPGDSAGLEKMLCMRVKKVFSFGTIGVLGVNNQNPSNQVLNLDNFITLPWNLYSSFQIAENWKNNERSDVLYHISLNRKVNRGFTFALTREYIPSDFDDVRGFLNMKNLINNSASVGNYQLVNKWGIQVFSSSVGYAQWDTENMDPIKKTKSLGAELDFLNNVKFTAALSDEKRWWEDAIYNNTLYSFGNSYYPGGNEGFGLSYTFGNYWGGKLYYPCININHTFVKRLSTTLNVSSQIFELGGETFRELILTFISSINLGPRLNFRTFLQWSDLYKELDTNFLLTYSFFTGSHVYFVWNEKRDSQYFDFEKETTLPLIDRKALCKICYQFTL